MPTADCGFADQPDFLARRGPTLSVSIGLDSEIAIGTPFHREAAPELWPALVDTGSATSCVDSQLAIMLRLPVVSQRTVSGVHGEGVVNEHLAQIFVPDLGVVFSGLFVGAHLNAGGQPHSAIIGRDFLRHFRLTYDGRTGAVALSSD